jgi:hypothetical protein
MRKLLISIGFVSFFVFSGGIIHAQLTFPVLYEQAKKQSTELVLLKASRDFLTLEATRIKAENTSPKAFLSSEYLFAPYFNNNGNIISTDPLNSAIGYDVGITNGGLYSFLINAELPVFNHNQVNNLLMQNNLEITKIDTRIKVITLELEHSLALQYLDALTSQAEYKTLRENLELIKQQLILTRSLTEHGLYRYVDFRLMQTAYIADSINLENSKTMFRLKMNQLKTICGITDTTYSQLADFDSDFIQNRVDTSLFLQTYIQDSLSTVIQQKVFENQYKPQVKIYANTGLNSASIPYIENHVGMSAGVQLTYTLFDGNQKQVNHQQQLVLMEQASREKELKHFELQEQKASYSDAIQSLNGTITKEEKLQKDYDEILEIYNEELQKAQVGVIEYLNFLQLFNQNKLTLENHKIERDKLIVEYNYWNN